MFHVERKNERMIFLKIGIISDTHNVLREEVVGHLHGCDYIIHAGDVCKEEVSCEAITIYWIFQII